MELHILTAIQEMHTPFLDLFFLNITALGDGGIFWILSGILLLSMKKTRKQGFLLLITLLICVLVGNVWLKNMIARDRPCWIYPEVQLLLAVPADYSFPSGHTMTSAAASTAILFTNRRWGTAAVILAAVIAFSRLYLFVHWPSDVLIGGIIGIAITFTVFAAEQWRMKRRENVGIHENV